MRDVAAKGGDDIKSFDWGPDIPGGIFMSASMPSLTLNPEINFAACVGSST